MDNESKYKLGLMQASGCCLATVYCYLPKKTKTVLQETIHHLSSSSARVIRIASLLFPYIQQLHFGYTLSEMAVLDEVGFIQAVLKPQQLLRRDNNWTQPRYKWTYLHWLQ